MAKDLVTVSKNYPSVDTVSEKLQLLLADSYSTLLLTHNYHWNVEGRLFYSLHKMFEEQYNELFAAVDEIAERARALDSYAFVGGYQDMLASTTFKAAKLPFGKDADKVAMQMVENLVLANEAIVKSAKLARKAAETAGDDETVDLTVERVTLHQKNIWMLKSHLK